MQEIWRLDRKCAYAVLPCESRLRGRSSLGEQWVRKTPSALVDSNGRFALTFGQSQPAAPPGGAGRPSGPAMRTVPHLKTYSTTATMKTAESSAPPAPPTAYSGAVCAGVLGDGTNGSWGQPGWTYESEYQVPPYPSGIDEPAKFSIYYYFNIIREGPADMGQFVPQLIAGAGLCNSTGAPAFNWLLWMRR